MILNYHVHYCVIGCHGNSWFPLIWPKKSVVRDNSGTFKGGGGLKYFETSIINDYAEVGSKVLSVFWHDYLLVCKISTVRTLALNRWNGHSYTYPRFDRIFHKLMCWIEIIEQVEPIEKLISYLKAQDHQKSPNIRRHIAFLYGQIVQVHCKYMISFKIRVNVMFLLTQK